MDKSNDADLISKALSLTTTPEHKSVDDNVSEVLRTIREHLGMDVAFVSEFIDGNRQFQYVDSGIEGCPIQVGDAGPLEESFCQRVVDGRLPELIHDALENPEAQQLAVTRALPVRSHLSVPIYFSDGELYGTFCCFNSSSADHTLDKRDLEMMRTFAAFSGKQIEQHIKADRARKEKHSRIRSAIDSKAFSVHYQPIFHLERNGVTGFESLARFNGEPRRTPDVWFREAAEVGLSEELELAAIAEALAALTYLPESVYVALNISPNNIISGAVGNLLGRGFPLERIVLEVTEHAAVSDYAALASALAPLRKKGLRFAVDDAGAGYASFLHILNLSPDIIKLDMSLIRDIDSMPKQQALAAAIIGFAEQTGSIIIAEGLETESELETLRALGVVKAQGYYLGKPTEIGLAMELQNTHLFLPRHRPSKAERRPRSAITR